MFEFLFLNFKTNIQNRLYGQGKFGKVWEKEEPIFQTLKVWDFL